MTTDVNAPWISNLRSEPICRAQTRRRGGYPTSLPKTMKKRHADLVRAQKRYEPLICYFPTRSDWLRFGAPG